MSYRKTSQRRKAKHVATYKRRRQPGEFRVRELRRLPWWCDSVVCRALREGRP
jgi:hypothetical protein